MFDLDVRGKHQDGNLREFPADQPGGIQALGPQE